MPPAEEADGLLSMDGVPMIGGKEVGETLGTMTVVGGQNDYGKQQGLMVSLSEDAFDAYTEIVSSEEERSQNIESKESDSDSSDSADFDSDDSSLEHSFKLN